MREELLYASTVGCDVASGWSPSWVTYMIGVERAVVGRRGTCGCWSSGNRGAGERAVGHLVGLLG